jgi:dTDP-4-dehydrorhamnose reductase
MSKILVIGSDGQIGRALVNHFNTSNINTLCTTRYEPSNSCEFQYDIDHGISSLPEICSKDIDIVFLCAGITGLSRCENDPKGSGRINVDRSVEIGSYFLRRGSVFVFLSSSAVFDGSHPYLDEQAEVSAINEYGLQKIRCEKMLSALAKTASGKLALVRLTKVLDLNSGIYKNWKQSFRDRKLIKAAADLVISPITSCYVANSLEKIANSGKPGVFHLSGCEDITYYDLATCVAKELGLIDLVKKDWISEPVERMPSKRHSSLSMNRTTALLGIKPQPLKNVIKTFLR